MKEDVVSAVLALALRNCTKEEFLNRVGVADGSKLSYELLVEARNGHDADGVEIGLIVGFTFGFRPEHFSLLVELANATWHYKHEDIVTAIGEFKNPEAVGVLVQNALNIPEYLSFDLSRALAVKAIWALGSIPGKLGASALRQLCLDESPIVRDSAAQQLRAR